MWELQEHWYVFMTGDTRHILLLKCTMEIYFWHLMEADNELFSLKMKWNDTMVYTYILLWIYYIYLPFESPVEREHVMSVFIGTGSVRSVFFWAFWLISPAALSSHRLKRQEHLYIPGNNMTRNYDINIMEKRKRHFVILNNNELDRFEYNFITSSNITGFVTPFNVVILKASRFKQGL